VRERRGGEGVEVNVTLCGTVGIFNLAASGKSGKVVPMLN
jgi:hypothetical protein